MKIAPEKFDAVLFDLDGVLTSTMTIHATSWQRMFNDYLDERAKSFGETHQPFEIASDYKMYVDGKLRNDGARAFLLSRGISLPEGDPDDPPGLETVSGLANRKDRMVKSALAENGVDLYEGSMKVVRHVRELGLKTAVVSASKNCSLILEVAGIRDMFDSVVDGTVASRHDLRGKPEPDTFLFAASHLGVTPGRAVVVEDAVSGVAAGKAGGFGLVIGIDHHGDAQQLMDNGADIVVNDLAEILENEA